MHPLFTHLEEAVWGLVPDVLQSSVRDVMDGEPDQVQAALQEQVCGMEGTWMEGEESGGERADCSRH